jgi:uncharacterized protein YndB with AHSA1/START domain
MNLPRPVTLTIAPVRKSIRVNTRQARAFEVFTGSLGRWWPKKTFGSSPLKSIVFEQHLGGRWYELGEDGTETTVGHILAWEPPHRFVVTWTVSCTWTLAPGAASEVEVRFIAEGPDATRIELEHRLFEAMGEPGANIREEVDGGWLTLLELFKAEAERQPQGAER